MAISLEPNNHDYHYNKGYVLLKQKKYHVAWQFFEKRIFSKKYENKLSNIIKNTNLWRQTKNDITVCDLTGTGVQDTAIARHTYDIANSNIWILQST